MNKCTARVETMEGLSAICGGIGEFPNPGGISAHVATALVCRRCLAEDVLRRMADSRRPFTRTDMYEAVLRFISTLWPEDAEVPNKPDYVGQIADDFIAIMRVTQEQE